MDLGCLVLEITKFFRLRLYNLFCSFALENNLCYKIRSSFLISGIFSVYLKCCFYSTNFYFWVVVLFSNGFTIFPFQELYIFSKNVQTFYIIFITFFFLPVKCDYFAFKVCLLTFLGVVWSINLLTFNSTTKREQVDCFKTTLC